MELAVKELKKSYGKKEVLKGVNYVFTPGIYGILGVNGAGKSTLIKLIADYIKADSGEITFDGKSITALKRDFRKKLGYMPQQQDVYKDMTAQSFLYYIADLKGVKRCEAAAQIEELLNALNLKRYRYDKMGKFSGGMKQRILLAQALIGNPQVLLLDEPTAGLDPKERIAVRNYISSLSDNRIILLTTHIISDIESIADKVLFLENGRMEISGSPLELINMISDKVGEIDFDSDGLNDIIKKEYPYGTIVQRMKGRAYRIVGDRLPDTAVRVNDNITLEDVYMYIQQKNTVGKEGES